ncbi:MAG: UDP-N-acetylmuramoyl-L-alanyl-D-glutamate--2,6-diaminopimelate ligase [Kiritimatiellae bacterium]|jgi:UDP-N-acetylmuramoyl-L-alanyl-D-glutamate--2,6-diaminopimelate ligase|nr:UDP-N-acetylmuramoyl-L-alanyl-D-glutamate--2,6-diaminopimelate ligase [Kiritimatiellia bacterium]
MKLNNLLEALEPIAVHPRSDPEIKGLAYDSRQVRPGYLFFALKGRSADGRIFIQDAVDRGAAAVVSEGARFIGRGQAVMLQVADARRSMGRAARVFYRNPSAKLKIIGITGTNGKTTTAFMIMNVLDAAGLKAGLIGTVEYRIGARAIPATRTTPEAVDIQQMLDQMAAAECRSAVMEVSSHALDQKRTLGVDFDAAVFTNLTHDHLDYHESMEKYFQAKAVLFRDYGRGAKKMASLINIDDPYGQQLARLPEIKESFIAYGLHDRAAVRAFNLKMTVQGSVFEVATPWGGARVSLCLPGRYNVSNALAAFSACGALGIKPDLTAEALHQTVFVPGRLEEIQTGAGFQVFVDYAHTEDALQNVLTALREISSGRLIVVFGCGGNRDVNKRPRMGAVAEQLADFAIVTSDNPRREEPGLIIGQILNGFKTREKVEVLPDRAEAIARALSLAEKGDVVLIAGKGHENYQEFANTIIPFDDRQVVREYLKSFQGGT